MLACWGRRGRLGKMRTHCWLGRLISQCDLYADQTQLLLTWPQLYTVQGFRDKGLPVLLRQALHDQWVSLISGSPDQSASSSGDVCCQFLVILGKERWEFKSDWLLNVPSAKEHGFLQQQLFFSHWTISAIKPVHHSKHLSPEIHRR